MPTLAERLIDPIPLALRAIFAALAAAGHLFPGRALPMVPRWMLRLPTVLGLVACKCFAQACRRRPPR